MKSYSAEHHHQYGANVADHRFDFGLKREAQVAVRVGVLFFEGRADGVCVVIGLWQRNAGFQAPDRGKKMRSSLGRHRLFRGVADHSFAECGPKLGRL
jgi:hypothetical protein